ncbi:MAG: ATP-grasp enzyme [Synechococcales cyanobacterium M58_A2018_015]|nr:ATP-grasp enzyme [Synechococcales cyanobacterium M58_A2018_015]
MTAALKTIGTLLLLLILLPINAALVLTAWIVSQITAPARAISDHPRTILLTGGKMTKALQLARSFYAAGHDVVLVETHKYWLSGHRFSRAVKRFYTVPAPELDPDAYSQALLTIVQREQVDVFIPVSSPVASFYDAVAGKQLMSHCEVIHFSPDITQQLDNKFTLCETARSLGLSAPQVFLITSPQQVLDFDFSADHRQYILKSIRYNSVSRLDLRRLPHEGMAEYVTSLPIRPDNPWVMQEFIAGQEYCTHSMVRQGQVRLHCCSRSSPFQVNYEQVDKPEILAWIEHFVGQLQLTGQISFDFIQAADGTVYPIECNPRTHSAITLFYNHPSLADAYLGDGPLKGQATSLQNDPQQRFELPITPLPDSKPTYWLYHELWRLTEVRSSADLQAWLNKVLRGKEALFQGSDPLPFLAVPHWQITLLLLNNLRQLKSWVRIDFNIGKLVELGGD